MSSSRLPSSRRHPVPGPAPGAPIRWQTARVLAVHDETPRAKTFRLELPHRTRHMAGQYFVLRLTAPDGYTASRAYSLSSPPEGPDGSDVIDLTVELLDDGEVSSATCTRSSSRATSWRSAGPIGAFFAWDGASPALLVAGGSGIVPLMAMLRLARRTGRSDLVRLLVSVRTPADLYFADELPGPEATVAYTRAAPPGSARGVGRLALADVAPLVRGGETVFVCGSARVRRGRDGPAARRGRADRVDPGGTVRAVRLSPGIDADTNGSRREHVRVRSTPVAGRRRRAAPSWRHHTCSTRESCMECTGGTRSTVRTAAAPRPSAVGDGARSAVSGRRRARRRPRAARRRHRGRAPSARRHSSWRCRERIRASNRAW